MATNDVYELAIRARLFNSDIVSVFHLQANGGFVPTQAQAQTLADDAKEALRPGQTQQLTYTTWTLRQVWGDGVTYHTSRPIRSGGRVYEGTLSGTLAGGNTTGTPLPSSVALVIQWKTGLQGRRNRGRTYVAGLCSDGLQTAGTPTATLITGISTNLAAFEAKYLPGGTDANWDLVVWSFRYASGWRPALAHPHHLEYIGPISSQNEANGVISHAVGNTWRSRRRREIGVGS
jgi:hypothetical protein